MMDRASWTDQEERVLAQARRGDEDATQRLFDHYFPLLRDRVRRRLPARLRRKVGESDVIQDAYLAAIRRLADFEDRGEGSFGGWLMTIVDRKVADQVRHYLGTRKRDAKLEFTRNDTGHESDVADEELSVGEPTRRKETVEAVLRSVERLPASDRSLIKLIHFEGQTIPHVAELQGSTADATRMRYSRALVKLRRLLDTSEPESA